MTKLQSVLKYGFLALNAVSQVQAEVGASNGDPNVQLHKKQLAVAYVLAAAHVGETVPLSKVQDIAAIVDMQASIAKALGLFGKAPSPQTVVAVPPADQMSLPQ